VKVGFAALTMAIAMLAQAGSAQQPAGPPTSRAPAARSTEVHPDRRVARIYAPKATDVSVSGEFEVGAPAHSELTGALARCRSATEGAAGTLARRYSLDQQTLRLGAVSRHPRRALHAVPAAVRGLGPLASPLQDWTGTITHCGPDLPQSRKVNLSQVFAGQDVGIGQQNQQSLQGVAEAAEASFDRERGIGAAVPKVFVFRITFTPAVNRSPPLRRYTRSDPIRRRSSSNTTTPLDRSRI
jgi:hypothetical protein